MKESWKDILDVGRTIADEVIKKRYKEQKEKLNVDNIKMTILNKALEFVETYQANLTVEEKAKYFDDLTRVAKIFVIADLKRIQESNGDLSKSVVYKYAKDFVFAKSFGDIVNKVKDKVQNSVNKQNGTE